MVTRALARIPRGAAAAMGARAASALLALLGTILVARGLGSSGYGEYALAVVVLNVVGILAVLGVDQLSARELATVHASGDWEGARPFLRWSLIAVLLASAAGASLAAALTLASGLEDGKTTAILVALAAVPAFALVKVYRGRLQALDRAARGIFFELTFLKLGILGAGLLLLAGVIPARGDVVALLHVVVVGFSALGAWWAFRIGTRAPAPGGPAVPLQYGLKPALAFAGIGFLTFVFLNGDVLLAGFLLPAGEVGVYSASSRLSFLLYTILSPIQLVVAPRFSLAAKSGDREEMRNLLAQSSFATLALALVPSLVLLAAPDRVLAFFGSEFVGGEEALRILTLAVLVSIAVGPMITLLSMAASERFVAGAFAVATGVALAGGLLLVPAFGGTGAALGRLLGSVVLGALVLVGFLAWRDRKAAAHEETSAAREPLARFQPPGGP